MSRLTSASLTANGIVKKQGFTFDPFGNLQQIQRWESGALVDTRTMSIDSSLNRIKTTGSPSWTASYDDAGDMTAWNRNDVGLSTSYAYSPLKDMRTMSLPGGRTFFYGYDADGERIAAHDSALASPNAGILYTLRGLDGKVRREFTEVGGTWSWRKDYIYRDGQLLASNSPTNGTRHYHLDHLGSPRLLTDRCRVTQARFVYFPFGEEASFQAGGQQDPERMRFTGHERDLADLGSTMDDLDYMHARYYSPILGRFQRLDAARGDPTLPQTWNRYAYVRSSPLSRTDPTGMMELLVEAAQGASVWDVAAEMGSGSVENVNLVEDNSPQGPVEGSSGGLQWSDAPGIAADFVDRQAFCATYPYWLFTSGAINNKGWDMVKGGAGIGFSAVTGGVARFGLANSAEALGLFPTRTGGGGYPQPISWTTKRFVPESYALSTEIRSQSLTTAGGFSLGFSRGWADALAPGPSLPANAMLAPAGRLGYDLGYYLNVAKQVLENVHLWY